MKRPTLAIEVENIRDPLQQTTPVLRYMISDLTAQQAGKVQKVHMRILSPRSLMVGLNAPTARTRMTFASHLLDGQEAFSFVQALEDEGIKLRHSKQAQVAIEKAAKALDRLNGKPR